jgi:hypothetical protein
MLVFVLLSLTAQHYILANVRSFFIKIGAKFIFKKMTYNLHYVK